MQKIVYSCCIPWWRSSNFAKTLLVMKLTIVFLTAAFLNVYAGGHSQTITLSGKNVELKKVFTAIKKQTGYVVFYNRSDLNGTSPVTLSVHDMPLSNFLDVMLKEQPLAYKIEDKTIMLYRRMMFLELPYTEPIREEVDRIVKGKVTDNKGVPLQNVSVIVVGAQGGTTTNNEGQFSITVSDNSNITLEFSSVGYQTRRMTVGNQTEVNVVLELDVAGLSDVVVVGYGTQKRGEVTGAIGSLKINEEISSRPIENVGQTLYGKISGVQVLQGSGKPGSSASIQIRGINSISAGTQPLIVINGIQMPNFDLNSLNVSDIESIQVLKDAASAAIYGSRGSNGVILITTRSGKSGDEPKVEVNYAHSFQKIVRKVDVMNAAEYAQAAIDAAQNGWTDIGGDPDAPNTIQARGSYMYMWPEVFETPDKLPFNTDWQDVVYRTAPMDNVNIALSGGGKSSNYRLSAGYLNQEGIMILTDYKKYTLNFNIDAKVGDRIDIGAFTNVLYDYGHNPPAYMSQSAIQYPSIYPVWGDDGNIGGPLNTPGFPDWAHWNTILFRANVGNPYYRSKDDYEFSNLKFSGNIYTDIKLLKGLNFKTTLNTYIGRADTKNHDAVDLLMGPSGFAPGNVASSADKVVSYTWDNLLTYNLNVEGHSLNLLLGYEDNNINRYRFTAERRNYANDNFPYLNAGGIIYGAGDQASMTRLVSYFSRLGYNYSGKYFITAQFRRDGSSRFGPNSKWGNFPSLSVAWSITQEPFMRAVESVLNDLRLRASYGFTGNDNFSDYAWISTMGQAKVSLGNNLLMSSYPNSLANPDLKWERTRQLNIGVDIGLWRNRLMIDANAYNSTSNDLLLNVPVPATSGFQNVFTNIGKIQNNGFDISISSRNLVNKLKWTTQVTFSTNKSKVLQMGPDGSPLFNNLNGGMLAANIIGKDLFSFFAYNYIGVYMSQDELDKDPSAYSTAKPGDGKYEDVNRDGKLDADDRKVIGKNTPDFIYGMTNTFTYGNFDFSFLINGLEGMDIYDVTTRRSARYHEGRNYFGKVTQRWRSEQDPGDGYVHRLTTTLDQMVQTASSYWLQDGSYIRLRSVTLGYSLPERLIKNMRISKIRVYFNATNPLMITDAIVNDPENFDGSATTMIRQSHDPYPTTKTFTFGLNVTF